MSSKAGSKRKLSSQGGSRAQQRKLATKAAKRSSAAAASLGGSSSSSSRRPEREREEIVNDGLFFDSDDEQDGARGGDDMRIRAPRRSGGGGGSDSDEEYASADEDGTPHDPYAHETPDEKRVRLAREYLSKIEQDIDEAEAGEEDAIDDELTREEREEEKRGITRDAKIESRLRADLLAQQGKLKSVVAHARYDASVFPLSETSSYMRTLHGHKKGGATCITMPEDCSTMYTGGKDCNIVAWDTETGKKTFTMFGNRASKYSGVPLNAQGHTDQVLSVSVSSDGQYLASGSADCSVKIWDTRAKHACIKTFFNAHKEAVTSVSFRMGSGHQLFTGSSDRTIRIYNIDQMAYVETLYGHTSDVTAIDSLYRDRCLSASRDKTIRLWKVVEETQLMFRASPFIQSVDALAMLNEEQFITGGQDGSVCAWINTKKKPTSVLAQAHGGEWITSVGAQRFTDVCFSGSSDGFLNLYCLESSGIRTNKLNQLHRIPVTGYINGMVSDARDGRFVALAMGQEHRLGRWNKIQPARNGIQLISLAGVDQQKYFAQEQKDGEERQEGERDEEEEEEDQNMDDGEEEEEEEKAAPAPKKRAVATKKAVSVKKAAARR